VVVSYEDAAVQVGLPGAARALGSAVRKNPWHLAFLPPGDPQYGRLRQLRRGYRPQKGHPRLGSSAVYFACLMLFKALERLA